MHTPRNRSSENRRVTQILFRERWTCVPQTACFVRCFFITLFWWEFHLHKQPRGFFSEFKPLLRRGRRRRVVINNWLSIFQLDAFIPIRFDHRLCSTSVFLKDGKILAPENQEILRKWSVLYSTTLLDYSAPLLCSTTLLDWKRAWKH